MRGQSPEPDARRPSPARERVGEPDARRPSPASGAFLIDKASGPTSFDVVRAVRQRLGVKKAGHAGTLDPLATGLLVVCVGEGTRLAGILAADDKEYVADFVLGVETDTHDAAGRIVASGPVPVLDAGSVEAVLGKFVGRIRQRPPAFSALKRDGVAYHRRARRGDATEPPEREVRIDAIEPIEMRLGGAPEPPRIRLRIRCGKGTYVRSLARDVGRALGCGAHVASLRRTRAGRLRVEDAVTLEGLDPDEAPALVSMADLVADLPRAIVGENAERRLRQGQFVPAGDLVEGAPLGERMRVLDLAGRLVALGTSAEAGMALRAVRVFSAA